MRKLGQAARNRILDEVRALLAEEFVPRLGNVDPLHIRTITGQQEGWFAWSDLNYRRGAGVNPAGILEMGGASLQYAFKVRNDSNGNPDVPDNQLNRLGFICNPNPLSLSPGDNVYSHVWPTGADRLKEIAFVEGRDPSDNPHATSCLPRGEDFIINEVQNIGNGSYQNCRHLLNHWRSVTAPQQIPRFSVLPASADTTRIAPLSNFNFVYKFFSNTDEINDGKGQKYDPQAVYNPDTFNDALRPYCRGNWADLKWAHNDPFRSTRCLNAAWMELTFGPVLVKGRVVDFSLQADWPRGAAALIRNHGGLRLCADADDLPPYLAQDLDGNAHVSFGAQILQNLDLLEPAQPASDTSTLFVPLWIYYLPFAVLFIFITHRLVQRSRAEKAIALPDLENALARGEKVRDMEDRGLGGTYKD